MADISYHLFANYVPPSRLLSSPLRPSMRDSIRSCPYMGKRTADTNNLVWLFLNYGTILTAGMKS